MEKAANNVAELINAKTLKEHTQESVEKKPMLVYEKESLA